ncbi:MAG: hypothetical protein ABWK15_03955 [Dissulfuribacterales bacterium]
MNLTTEECQYLFNNLPAQLTAMLLKGLVHNLNGPLQVISMQTELISKIKSINQQQIDNLQANITRLEKQIQCMANHADTNNTQAQPIILNDLIEQELTFWNADLFFKHKVTKTINMFQKQVFTTAQEATARGIIGSCIALSIENLRHKTPCNFEITCSITDNPAAYSITFNQNGSPFTEEQKTDSARQAFETFYPASLLKKYLSVKTVKTGWTLCMDPQKLSIVIPA